MQLRHNDALGTVHDKRAGGGHQWDFAHIDFLLFHFLDGRLGGLFVHDDQAHTCPQRRAECQATLLTFFDVKRGLAEVVLDELQASKTIMRDDWENRQKGGLKAFVLTISNRDSGLQECIIGLKLSREHIGHIQYRFTFRKTLANTLFLGVGIG